jgi:hypothetical protein
LTPDRGSRIVGHVTAVVTRDGNRIVPGFGWSHVRFAPHPPRYHGRRFRQPVEPIDGVDPHHRHDAHGAFVARRPARVGVGSVGGSRGGVGGCDRIARGRSPVRAPKCITVSAYGRPYTCVFQREDRCSRGASSIGPPHLLGGLSPLSRPLSSTSSTSGCWVLSPALCPHHLCTWPHNLHLSPRPGDGAGQAVVFLGFVSVVGLTCPFSSLAGLSCVTTASTWLSRLTAPASSFITIKALSATPCASASARRAASSSTGSLNETGARLTAMVVPPYQVVVPQRPLVLPFRDSGAQKSSAEPASGPLRTPFGQHSGVFQGGVVSGVLVVLGVLVGLGL